MARPWKPTARVYDRKAGEHVDVKLEVTVDWDRLAFELAKKAHANKSGKSRFMSGIITAKELR